MGDENQQKSPWVPAGTQGLFMSLKIKYYNY